MGQRYAPQQRGGGKARQIATGAAAQRHHAAGAVKAAAQDAAAQFLVDGQGLGALTGGDGVQRRVQSGGAEAAQHRIAVQLGGVFVGHYCPAGDVGRTAQQGTGLRQKTIADIHGIGGVLQLDGELFHGRSLRCS